MEGTRNTEDVCAENLTFLPLNIDQHQADQAAAEEGPLFQVITERFKYNPEWSSIPMQQLLSCVSASSTSSCDDRAPQEALMLRLCALGASILPLSLKYPAHPYIVTTSIKSFVYGIDYNTEDVTVPALQWFLSSPVPILHDLNPVLLPTVLSRGVEGLALPTPSAPHLLGSLYYLFTEHAVQPMTDFIRLIKDFCAEVETVCQAKGRRSNAPSTSTGISTASSPTLHTSYPSPIAPSRASDAKAASPRGGGGRKAAPKGLLDPSPHASTPGPATPRRGRPSHRDASGSTAAATPVSTGDVSCEPDACTYTDAITELLRRVELLREATHQSAAGGGAAQERHEHLWGLYEDADEVACDVVRCAYVRNAAAAGVREVLRKATLGDVIAKASLRALVTKMSGGSLCDEGVGVHRRCVLSGMGSGFGWWSSALATAANGSHYAGRALDGILGVADEHAVVKVLAASVAEGAEDVALQHAAAFCRGTAPSGPPDLLAAVRQDSVGATSATSAASSAPRSGASAENVDINVYKIRQALAASMKGNVGKDSEATKEATKTGVTAKGKEKGKGKGKEGESAAGAAAGRKKKGGDGSGVQRASSPPPRAVVRGKGVAADAQNDATDVRGSSISSIDGSDKESVKRRGGLPKAREDAPLGEKLSQLHSAGSRILRALVRYGQIAALEAAVGDAMLYGVRGLVAKDEGDDDVDGTSTAGSAGRGGSVSSATGGTTGCGNASTPARVPVGKAPLGAVANATQPLKCAGASATANACASAAGEGSAAEKARVRRLDQSLYTHSYALGDVDLIRSMAESFVGIAASLTTVVQTLDDIHNARLAFINGAGGLTDELAKHKLSIQNGAVRGHKRKLCAAFDGVAALMAAQQKVIASVKGMPSEAEIRAALPQAPMLGMENGLAACVGSNLDLDGRAVVRGDVLRGISTTALEALLALSSLNEAAAPAPTKRKRSKSTQGEEPRRKRSREERIHHRKHERASSPPAAPSICV